MLSAHIFKFIFSSPGRSPGRAIVLLLASALALASGSALALASGSALAKSLTLNFFMWWARRCQASYPVPVTGLVLGCFGIWNKTTQGSVIFFWDHVCITILYITAESVLQIRRGNRDNLGIIFHIFHKTYVVISFKPSHRDGSNEGSHNMIILG